MTSSSSLQHPDEERAAHVTKFFADFSKDDLQKIYSIGEVRRFAAGDVAISQGDPGTSMYIVLEGQAEVTIPKQRGWLKVANLVPGSVFGELSFLDHTPRSARVSVVEDCTVLEISEASFKQLADQDTSIALAFIRELAKILSDRVRRMNQLVQALAR